MNVLDLVQTGFVQRVQSKEGKVISLFFVVSFYENKLVRDKTCFEKASAVWIVERVHFSLYSLHTKKRSCPEKMP